MTSVYLQGSEEVARAGQMFQEAALEMGRAAARIDETYETNARRMNDWLSDLRLLVERLEVAMKGPPT